MSDLKASELELERDEAQSCVQAWVHVVEGLEAHIKDRAAMKDPANPETYLSILRDDVAAVQKRSEQICASRWHDYRAHQDTIASLTLEVAQLKQALGKVADEAWHAMSDDLRETVAAALKESPHVR